jgi:hypothetical protein
LSKPAVPNGYDPRPELVDRSIVALGEFSIILTMGMSIVLNTYHDLRGGNPINPYIAVSIGIVVPVLIAMISHVAATLRIHWAVQAWIFLLVIAFMYVSAVAGTDILKPHLSLGPALVISLALDASALTMLGILIYARHQKTALAEWLVREEARCEAAILADTQGRYGRRPLPGNGGGNAGGNGEGNARGNAWGNGFGLGQGNAPRAIAAGQGNPGTGSSGAGSGGGEGTPGTPSQDSGDGDTVTPFVRRPRQTDEEIRMLAEDLARKLAVAGEELSVGKYRAAYGGKAERVSPIVGEVKAAFAAARVVTEYARTTRSEAPSSPSAIAEGQR